MKKEIEAPENIKLKHFLTFFAACGREGDPVKRRSGE
jgi:hypothetical protein